MADSTKRIEELRRDLAANPTSRQFYQVGELLRREGRAGEAADVLRSGLAHHPRYVAAWVALGRACVDAGASEEAATALREALALDAANPVAWRLLGEAHLALGDRRAALDAMQRCLELVPGDEVLKAAVEALSSETQPPVQKPAPIEPPVAPPTAPPAAEPFASAPTDAPPALPQAALPASAAGDVAAASLPLVFPLEEPFGPFGEALAPMGGDVFTAAPEFPPLPEGGVFGVPPAGGDVATATAGPLQVEAVPEAVALPPAPSATLESLDALFAEPTAAEVQPIAPPAPLAPSPMQPAAAAPIAPAAPPPPVAPPAAPLPRATVALARLYVQQQDLAGASDVLARVIERDASNVEARELLALIHDMMAPLPEPLPSLSPRERKIAALQRWLAGITLAKEEAAP